MGTQTFLTILLGILVVVLTLLLFTRLRREKRQMAAIRRMNLAEFSDFLRTNCLDGTIQEVASKVSDLLKKSFGCELIIFLRKKRSFLELNYFHGMKKVVRNDFRLVFDPRLVGRLKADFLPRRIEQLKDLLPAHFYRRLQSLGADIYFPIFWRDNLYGLYFIRSTIETGAPSFTLLVAGLAQSLSAAYHIKWHESRYDSLQKQLDDTRTSCRKEAKTSQQLHANILKLVRHRNSETIVPRLICSVRKDLGMSRVAFLYQDSRHKAAPRIYQEGMNRSLDPPRQESFQTMLETIDSGSLYQTDELAKRDSRLREWSKRFKESGLTYVTTLPLTSERTGVLAFSTANVSTIARQLQVLKAHVSHVVDNAESYERMEEMSYTDNLTRLANQRYFLRRLDEEISRAKRYNRKLALIFFDLDELKTTNDKYGHLAGDEILRQMGQILKRTTRTIDIVARYGGDEFCIIMPETDVTTCVKFMDRLKAEVSQWKFTIEGAGVSEQIWCTISQGGAVFPDHADDAKQLVFAAEMALLKAKEAGRNTLQLYQALS
ncbi:MAG: GGDEF domain-containing protein [Candidatus Zixiibacteriota bacterium]